MRKAEGRIVNRLAFDASLLPVFCGSHGKCSKEKKTYRVADTYNGGAIDAEEGAGFRKETSSSSKTEAETDDW